MTKNSNFVLTFNRNIQIKKAKSLCQNGLLKIIYLRTIYHLTYLMQNCKFLFECSSFVMSFKFNEIKIGIKKLSNRRTYVLYKHNKTVSCRRIPMKETISFYIYHIKIFP